MGDLDNVNTSSICLLALSSTTCNGVKISVQIHEHKSGGIVQIESVVSLPQSRKVKPEHEADQSLCISCIPGKHWFIGKITVTHL